MKDKIKTSAPALKPTSKPAPKPRDPYIRAENEDDDGYDPYSCLLYTSDAADE